MNTTGIIATVAMATAVTFGGFYGIMQMDHTQRMERKVSDRCWIDGGTYKDGTCERPEDTLTDQEKVCMAMKGSYVIIDTSAGREFRCYEWQGKELEMPDLTGKEVIVIDDTVVLRDRD